MNNFVKQLTDLVCSDLASKGFRHKGPLIFRTVSDNYQILQIQKDRGSDRYCVNYGMASTSIIQAFGGNPKQVPGLGHWHFNSRVGGFNEKWWTVVNSDQCRTVAVEMAVDIVDEALPQLEQFTSDTQIRDKWLNLFVAGKLKTSLPVLEGLMVLLRRLGPAEVYDEVKSHYLYIARSYAPAKERLQQIEAVQLEIQR